MAKMEILFDGFEALAEQIDKCGNDLHKAVDEALTETQRLIQNKLTMAAAPYAAKGKKGYATGEMYNSILKDARITWNGNVAEVDVGFDLLSAGGFHSIFIMTGVPAHRKNHTGITKDAKVFQAVKGAATKKAIAEKQEEIMMKYVNLGDVK